MHQQLQNSNGVVVLDRTIYEDAEIFATALHMMRKFTGRDWDTYWNFYQVILQAIRPPDDLPALLDENTAQAHPPSWSQYGKRYSINILETTGILI